MKYIPLLFLLLTGCTSSKFPVGTCLVTENGPEFLEPEFSYLVKKIGKRNILIGLTQKVTTGWVDHVPQYIYSHSQVEYSIGYVNANFEETECRMDMYE